MIDFHIKENSYPDGYIRISGKTTKTKNRNIQRIFRTG